MCEYDPTLKVLGSWKLCLDIEAVSLNKLKGKTSAVTARMYSARRNKFERLITPLIGHIPIATARRRVTFTRIYKVFKKQTRTERSKFRFDNDNISYGFKGARDVLTRHNLLIDDNDKYAQVFYLQRPGPEDAVEILIEDVAWT